MSQVADHDARPRKELKLVQFSSDENNYYIQDGDNTIGYILHINTESPSIRMR